MEMEFTTEFRTVLNNLRTTLLQPGQDRASLARQRATLVEVDAALRRIENGSYGVCSACFLVIPRRDLLDKPHRSVCSRCTMKRAASAMRSASRLKAA